MTTLQKVFLWIVRIGIWVIPLLPFYISSSMLFPFITGKNFAFRLTIEGIFPFWVGLAIMRPEYRPKLTPLFKAVAIFTAVIFFADLFGMNPYRSFFSNYERMEGFMMIGHLYLYFLMLVSVFRNRRDWLIFFHVSLAASTAVAYYAILQKLGLRVALQGGFRVDSTIGNPTYLAAYMIFHMWLLLILIKQFLHRWWQAAVYGVLFILDFAIVYFTATRGAAIALVVVSVPLMAAVILLWSRIFFTRRPGNSSSGKKLNTAPVRTDFSGWSRGRIIAAVLLTLMVLVPAILWGMRKSAVIQSNPALSRLTNYSLSEGTIQARFKIWAMAWQGFKERPILGWGQENFYLVFQKYFNPSLYGEEPWFDRSHNLIFDWLIHGGILGLVSYVAVLGIACRMIVRGIRKRAFPVWEGLMLLGMFATYVIQNIFVFDNLNTYLLYFAFLAYVHYLTYDVGDETKSEVAQPRPFPVRSSETSHSYAAAAVIGLLAVTSFFGYTVNVKAMSEGRTVIDILRAVQGQKSVDEIIGVFKQALGYGTFGDGEVREQLINVGQSVIANDKYSADDRKRYVAYAIDEVRKITGGPARDVKHVMYLGSFMDRAATFDPAYMAQAEQVLLDALSLSPTKQPTYFELARVYFATGRKDEAVNMLKKAWELDKSYDQAMSSLWAAAALAKRQDVLNELRSSVDMSKISSESLERIGVAYRRAEDYQAALPIYAQLVTMAPANPGYHATYAALLAQVGRNDEAIREVEAAMSLDKSFETEGKQFIDALQKQKQQGQKPASQPKKTK